MIKKNFEPKNLSAVELPRETTEEQVIANYVSNALKYTPSLHRVTEARDQRDTQGVVKVAIAHKGNDIVVSVSDNGIGIPKKEIPKLFNKFIRATNAKEIYTDGTGLGLYIVKEIVGGHNGKVWLESEEDKGSTFYFSLPVAGVALMYRAGYVNA